MTSKLVFPILPPDLQISLYTRLQSLRKLYLREGLKATVEADSLSLEDLDDDLAKYVPPKDLKRLAASGLRGEIVFPVPYLLERNPFLLGYYRLLFGFSQKVFYEQGPFKVLKGLEEKGKINPAQKDSIPSLCKSLIQTASKLIETIDPVATDIVNDLQLLTLGPQLRGSRNVDVGQAAVEVIFDLLKGLVVHYSPAVKGRTITFANDSRLLVEIHFGGDPDVSITQKLGSENRKLVAIEIKGGTDVSNIWNRLGEAEKSHRSAKAAGFNELWTVTGVDLDSTKDSAKRATVKSPTTTRLFHLPRIVDSASREGMLFRQVLGSIIGAKLG